MVSAFFLGITLFVLMMPKNGLIAGYISHFNIIYFEHWLWYPGSKLTSQATFTLFFLIFFSHLSLYYFNQDTSKRKIETFLPVIALILLSFLNFYFLLYQSQDYYYLQFFPLLLVLFVLLFERYLVHIIPYAFWDIIEKLKVKAHIKGFKSLKIMGIKDFSIALTLFLTPFILYFFVMGTYPVYRTGVTKYFITAMNSFQNEEGETVTSDKAFDEKNGIWVDRKQLIHYRELEDYLKLNVKLFEEVYFIPRPYYGYMSGFFFPSPFYTPENVFTEKYRQQLIKKLEHSKPAYIVVDEKDDYLHLGADFFVGEFEKFVEKNYRYETQFDRYIVLKLRKKPANKDAYISLNKENATFKTTSLILQSTTSFPESKVKAVDITYTFYGPKTFPDFFVRPFIKLRYFKKRKEVAVKIFLVPYSETPNTVRVKLRNNDILADRVTVKIAGSSHSIFKPIKADLLGMEVFTTKKKHQTIAGITVPLH
ncbi:MAG: hypothetical protein HQK84_11955 [Nitrospinae bacterium]|nr:hypothetical protein [Nitrospinota bacterium]